MSDIMKKLYSDPSLSRKEYVSPLDEQETMLKEIETRKDTEALRMKQYLAMKDLSRTENSPIKEMIDRVTNIPIMKGFDLIKVPEVVTAEITFDLFNFPANHPARSKSDTYYVNETNILRTHTTVMWYYYLGLKEIMEKAEKGLPIGVLSFGKVYRKDEIDKNHMNIFHQIDGLYLCKTENHIITQEDLRDVLSEIAKSVFGENIKYRFNDDTFPYTNQSIEMEIEVNSKWVEVLGAGVVQPPVLEKLGIDSEKYNGWAFGFGLERLAIISMDLPDIRLFWSEDPRVTKQLKLGNKFVEVSKYPPIVRDISFVVRNDFIPNDYFDLVREIAPDLVEEVHLLDKYENVEKFGKDMLSYAFRITYRSTERTLTSSEIDSVHKKLEQETVKVFGAKVR
jgi:phenylalanyl-tRNA synthetase alpha chain